MTVYELAFACHVYSAETKFDKSYIKLSSNPLEFEIRNEDDVIKLIVWLRAWGCRQFHKDNSSARKAINSITLWHNKYKKKLFSKDKSLLALHDGDFEIVKEAFEELASSSASTKTRIGPTGASKILFALRPKALIPWDSAIREEKCKDLSKEPLGYVYIDFLEKSRDELKNLNEQLNEKVKPSELPTCLGRQYSTPAKLIDEYNWITITKRIKPPDISKTKEWIALGKNNLK